MRWWKPHADGIAASSGSRKSPGGTPQPTAGTRPSRWSAESEAASTRPQDVISASGRAMQPESTIGTTANQPGPPARHAYLLLQNPTRVPGQPSWIRIHDPPQQNLQASTHTMHGAEHPVRALARSAALRRLAAQMAAGLRSRDSAGPVAKRDER